MCLFGKTTKPTQNFSTAIYIFDEEDLSFKSEGADSAA